MRRAAFLCFLFVLVSFAGTNAADERPPNIVLILADDLGYGDLSCYGHPKFRTPRLDRLATEGARLTQFNTPMPFCAPTRAALLTGRYPFRSGMNSNPAPDGRPESDKIALSPNEILLPQLLKQAGYATGMVGKWHLGHREPAALPMRRGFDEYLGILYSNDMRPVELIEGERAVEFPLAQATLTKRYAERAIEFIEKNREQPFFLYLAHAMPHKPLACSEEFYKQSGAGLYGDVIAELDASVGRVLDKLDELKLSENTLVVFTSDNGPWYGGSTGGLRGMKGMTWEGGYRVPCIARWPGKIPAGQTSHELGVMMDLFATALAAAQVPAPDDRIIDGQNLLPVLAGEKSQREVVLGQRGPEIATVRDGRWKLHVLAPGERRQAERGTKWIDPRGPDGVTILAPYEQATPEEFPGLATGDKPVAEMLFDLHEDPGEQRNVASANPEVVERLKAQLAVLRDRG